MACALVINPSEAGRGPLILELVMQIVATTSRNYKVRVRAAACVLPATHPGIVYGAGQAAQKIEIDHNNLFHALKKEEFHTTILDLEVDGKSTKVVLRDVRPPLPPLVLHVDFQRVDENDQGEIQGCPAL